MNIAMWSGPRNLSTAMMYSFGAREDCAVWDEPFYAAYLEETGLVHPMRDEIIAAGEKDPQKVATRCATAHPSGKAHFYQKHMTHHMIEAMPRDWFDQVSHVFLIRHPARVLASYAQKRDNPTLEDIGFRQQAEIYQSLRDTGQDPLIVDSYDIRQSPEHMLRAICEGVGIAYDPNMTSWPKGGHPDNGAWAPHWYNAVHQSTGFAGAEGGLPDIPEDLKPVLQAALPYYSELREKAVIA